MTSQQQLLDRERQIWNSVADAQMAQAAEWAPSSFDDWVSERVKHGIFAEFLRDHALKDQPVLQLGAGDAFFLRLPDLGYRRFIVADLADRALDLARERSAKHPRPGEVEFIACDAHALPLPDQSVGLIIANAVVHHLRREEMVAQFDRVLMPGGRAVFIDYYLNGPLRLLLHTRRLRRVDRGTDNPMSQRDIRLFATRFKLTARYFGFLSDLAYRLFRPRDPDKARSLQNKLVRADLSFGALPLYGKNLSSTVVLMLEKSKAAAA